MQKQPIVITGMGHFFPETVLDNQFFDSLDIGSSAEWIDERVGIKERRSVMSREDIRRLRNGEVSRDELFLAGRIMSIAAMSREPWSMACRRAGYEASAPGIDTVICGTSVPDNDIPANACAIARDLNISGVAFDINSACSSFVVDLHSARAFAEGGTSTNIAVFNPERYSTRMDYRDRASCVLFGDAATCAVVETGSGKRGLQIMDTVLHSDPQGFDYIQIPDSGYFHQNGKVVQKFAVTRTVNVTYEVLERNGMQLSDITYFIGHQANYRMLESACARNGISDAQHLYNVDVRGNQGAAGAPSVLSSNWDRFKPGDVIVISVVGAGLTWGAALLRCV
jgi:3-oxoacyl-[acyl-carrier-protein] synthase-3